MSVVKFNFRIFLVLFLLVSLIFSAFESTPAHAQTNSINSNDKAKINVPVPATTINAQQAYIKASLASANYLFGSTMALDGDTLVVGVPYERSNATGINGDETNTTKITSGAVYVYTRSGGTWSQQAYIKASNTDTWDRFGYAVAISGDTLVVGAAWEDGNGVDGESDNSTIDAGAAYVFTRTAGVWSQQAYLKASNVGANDNFGYSVAISGDTLVVGADAESSNATGVNGNQTPDPDFYYAGAAYVFTRSGNVWSQQAYIKASNTDGGDAFGRTIALEGDTLAVGAPYESSNATTINGNQMDNSKTNAGAVYVFTRDGSNVWSQEAYLKTSNGSDVDNTTDYQLGNSLAMSGDTIVAGKNNSSSVNVFVRAGNSWSEQASLIALNGSSSDGFGESVSIAGDTVIVGASTEDGSASNVNGPYDDDLSGAGAAYVFKRTGSMWGQQAYVKASNPDAGDSFGHSVAISGTTLAVGAPFEDSNSSGINGDQGNNLTPNAGAAYVLTLPPMVVSSIPADANPTPATSLHFTLTFSEPMTGVDLADLALTTTGSITGVSITGITGGPTVYTVTVSTGSGEGTIQLNVLDDDSILTAATMPLGGAGTGNGDFSTGQAYIIDRTVPTVIASEIVYPTIYDTQSTEYFTVYFSENVTGVDVNDFTLTITGAITGAYVESVSGSEYTYTVGVYTGEHIGTIRLNVADNDSIVDVASNPLGGVGIGNGNFTTGQKHVLDRTFTMTFNSTSALDGWVLESSENSNKGGSMNSSAKTFQIGDDALNRQYKGILSFDTWLIPDNAVIKEAEVTIFRNGAVVGGDPFKALGTLWADIHKGPFGTPGLQLADFSSAASASKVGFFKNTSQGYINTLTAAGRNNVNKRGLTQFRLYFALDDNNNRKANYIKFDLGTYPSTFPSLTVTYTVP